MTDLKLIALDNDDLPVVSAHLQDAVVRVGDLDFDRRAGRFACVLNRFDWSGALGSGRRMMSSYERRRAGLRIERVLGVRTLGIDLARGNDPVRGNDPARGNDVLSLLALSFSQGDAPGGCISLVFSGGAAIALEVECIEVELRDLGAAWTTFAKPIHRLDGRE